MEHKQFTSEDLALSPHSNHCFQADRFTKKTNQLNIPDTIPENCSAELSGDSLKMEVPKILIESFSNDDKENISCNQQVICNESSHVSPNITIDNSFIKQCERKLLDNSIGDDEKNEFLNNAVVNSHLLKVSRKFNETISTPPSLLRKEISMLRAEMAEIHEFHDIEIQLLKEEKFLKEVDSENNAELLEKYSTLMELYTALKASYEDYRKAQEKMGRELQSKTADCLESLCSQIEASDNSLNFSSASFMSFTGGIRSSTMMEDVSEVEATVVHDATVLAKDPLSITSDGGFRTPMQTPSRSVKALFPQELNSTVSKPAMKEVNEILANITEPLDSEYNIQLLNLETALYDKIKEVKDLEQRLFKVEDLSSALQNEFERISSVYAAENNALKENLSVKTEQLNEMTQKLFTETISLDPSLRDSLTDAPGKKLLLVFIETIMEKCKKIRCEDSPTAIENLRNQLASQEANLLELDDLRKTCENLERKLSDAENTLLTRDEEIQMLQSHLSKIRQRQKESASDKEALSELESRFIFEEAQRKVAENRCLELEEVIKNQHRDIDSIKQLQTDLQNQLSAAEEVKLEMMNENSRLKESYTALQLEMSETEKILKSNEFELITIRQKLTSADETIQQLKCQLKTIEEEKSGLQNQFSELQNANQILILELTAAKSLGNVEELQTENENLRLNISESEKMIAELKTELESAKQDLENSLSKMEEFMKEIERLNAEKSGISETLENLEKGHKNLAELLSDIGSDSDLPSERITKLVENVFRDSKETRDFQILSAFTETLTKTCKGIQNELKQKFDIEKHEWETQRDDDLNLIKSLKDEINLLVEKSGGYETKILEICIEKQEVVKLHENLKNEFAEAEKVISTYKNEIQSHEDALKQANDKLAAADEALVQLKSQLSSAENDKVKVEQLCRELEEIRLNLQVEINAKEAILQQIEEFKTAREKVLNENEELKEKILELENRIADVTSILKTVEEERTAKEFQVEESQNEINVLKKEKEDLKKSLEASEKEQMAKELQIKESQNEIDVLKKEKEDLKKSLEASEEIQTAKELQIKDSQNEINMLNKEKEGLADLTKKLENLEKMNKNLMNVISDVQTDLNMPEDTINTILSGENNKLFSDRINNLIRTQMDVVRAEKEVSELQTKQTELEELRKICSNLETKLSEAEKTISEREEEVRTLQLNVTQAREDIATVKTALGNLETKLASAENQKSDAENQCQKLEEAIEILNREIAEKESLRTGLEAQLSCVEDQKTDAENRYTELEKIVENLKLEIVAGEKVRTEIQSQLSLVEEKKSELENERVQLKQSYDSLKAEMVGIENAVAQRDEEIRILKSNESSQENNLLQLEELKKTRESLESKLLEANSTISAREEEVQKLQSELTRIQEEFSSTVQIKEKELEDLRNSLSNLEAKLSEAEEAKSAWEAKLKELEELRSAFGVLETKLSEAEKTNSAWEAKLMELEELRSAFGDLETKLSEAQKTISEREEEIRFLHLHLTQTQEDFAAVKTAIADLESKLASAESHKSDTENRCIELEKAIDDLNREIVEKENLRVEFENENLRLKQSFDALKLKMTETENAISTRDEEIRELKSYECQLTSIKESLASADETILKLKSQLQSVESEKSEMENRCTQLEENNQNLKVEVSTAKNLENNPVYEKIQTENGDLKERIFESEKMMAELKAELEVAKKDQMSNICKVEELIREIEDLKKENDGFSCALSTIEETQKNLADVLSNPANDSDMPSDRITKLIGNSVPDFAETRETKIMSEFVETIAKTCKGVQNELIKKFDSKKLEWETQKDFDIQNLQQQIKVLSEKNKEHEIVLKQTKQELIEADETIDKLKSQLSSTEVEKVEIQLRVQKLEENTRNLQSEIDTKETIIKGLDELKIVRQKIEYENGDLKRKILESEEVIVRLKKSLEIAKEGEMEKESRIKDSLNEIEILKKEKERLTDLTEKLENLEKSNKNLMDVIAEVQTHLEMPGNTLSKILSGEIDISKIFSEKINNLIKGQTEGLKAENQHLKLGNDNLKEKVKQLTKLIGETASETKEELSSLNVSHSNSLSLRSKSGRKSDLCIRRLDKLEEINHNLTELITRILAMTGFPDSDKLRLYSVRDFPNVMKKVVAHMKSLDEKMKEVKEENAQLDEECETYAKIIKDLKKEAAAVWKTNKEKTEEMEAEINRLKEEKNCLENEKLDLLAKISKLDAECQKLKSSKTEGAPHNCVCGNDSKKINELKRTILVKEQKLLELQDLEAQTSSYKSQIEYLKNALEREKKKIGEEKEKNKKLQNDLNEATKKQKTDQKAEENQVLDELRMRGSLSGGIVQEFVDKEKMRKLSKDIGILKELCRARYAEIKRLEAVNAALRNSTPKNSNQMDSPIRTRGYNTRSKVQPRDLWKNELVGKENGGL